MFSIGDTVKIIDYLIPSYIGKTGIVRVIHLKAITPQYGLHMNDYLGSWGDLSVGIPLGHGLWVDEPQLQKSGVILSKCSGSCSSDADYSDFLNWLKVNNISAKDAKDALKWYFGK